MNGFIAAPIINFFSSYINTIIVFLFMINLLIFIIIIYRSHGIKRLMDETRGPETARLDPHWPGETYLQKLLKNYGEWSRRYRSITPWVHYYSILTTIFPLLGILGTICGLLQASNDFSQVQGSFLLALSSTFFGLVAAILSKAGEGFFSPDIDRFKVVYEMFTKDIINVEGKKKAAGPDAEEPEDFF